VIGNIAAQTINRIRWVNDEAAFTQHLHHLLNGFWIWVFGVDLYEHAVLISEFGIKNRK
jgi:hypothetical protein